MASTIRGRDLHLEDLEQDDLDVLDLPQIYTKPSARTLLATLDLLTVAPRSWDVTAGRTPRPAPSARSSGMETSVRTGRRKVRPEGVPQYLTNIISSRLAWIEDEEEKEQVWDNAAKRLSERSGRTARGGFTRTFSVPLRAGMSASRVGDDHCTGTENGGRGEDRSEISIYEPGLTADNLGHKTWAASYVLARQWVELEGQVPALTSCRTTEISGGIVLELGAGTGLVGLAAAAVLGVRVLLTDLPEITPNLERNIHDNLDVLSTGCGSAQAAVLDWSDPLRVRRTPNNTGYAGPSEMDVQGKSSGLEAAVVVAADPIYSADHPRLLVDAISAHLSHRAGSALVIGLPLRESYGAEREDLRQRLRDSGMELLFERTEVGLDDWSHGQEEEACEVECNISVWAWVDGTR